MPAQLTCDRFSQFVRGRSRGAVHDRNEFESRARKARVPRKTLGKARAFSLDPASQRTVDVQIRCACIDTQH